MQLQANEWEPRYARRAERMRASEIRELLKLLDEPGIILPAAFPIPPCFRSKPRAKPMRKRWRTVWLARPSSIR